MSSVPTTDDLTAGNLPAGNVEDHTYSRVRLAYDNIDNITQLQYKDANGNLQDIEGMEITYLDADGNVVFFIQAGEIAGEIAGVLRFPFNPAELLSAVKEP